MQLLSTSVYLPPSQLNDAADNMWAQRAVALVDDHPANMAARALTNALASAGVEASELALVVYCGRARDYLPGWSVANEVMHSVGASRRCVGLDLAMGCATLPAALEVAHGWLATPGRRYAAIIDAERWNEAIDRTDPASQRMWAYGDGAGAVVVASDASNRTGFARYIASAFAGRASNNAFLRPEYGGTRRPYAEHAEQQLRLTLDGTLAVDVFSTYTELYEAALADLAAHAEFSPPQHVVCTQLSPAWVTRMISRFHTPRPRSVVVTGNGAGHVGGVDLLLGLDSLVRRGDAQGHVLLAGTAPFVTALALLRLTAAG
ncbi:MAG TPA: hypothetical protein VGM39_02865 [Kofleriaceae bacterium]